MGVGLAFNDSLIRTLSPLFQSSISSDSRLSYMISCSDSPLFSYFIWEALIRSTDSRLLSRGLTGAVTCYSYIRLFSMPISTSDTSNTLLTVTVERGRTLSSWLYFSGESAALVSYFRFFLFGKSSASCLSCSRYSRSSESLLRGLQSLLKFSPNSSIFFSAKFYLIVSVNTTMLLFSLYTFFVSRVQLLCTIQLFLSLGVQRSRFFESSLNNDRVLL